MEIEEEVSKSCGSVVRQQTRCLALLLKAEPRLRFDPEALVFAHTLATIAELIAMGKLSLKKSGG